jgi:hypothetical protein
MKIVESMPHDTENTFFVVYARIMIGDTLVPGYRIVGKNEPSGLYFESAPSCSDLCKASGPYIEYEECCNEQCTPIASPAPNFDVEEGNVAFEAPVYENGIYYLMVVDPEWQQVSETFEIPIDFEDRKWFYYVFRQ